MRTAAALTAGMLVLGACTQDAASPEPAPTVTVTVTESSTAAPRPTATDGSQPIEAPPNDVQPGTAAPGSVASLETVAPDELDVALVAVDIDTGTVSWHDGFGWQSFDVDAALDAGAWFTDGGGGLVIESIDGTIWHLIPFSDEPTKVLDPPPDEDDQGRRIQSRLVGAGILADQQVVIVEQGIVTDPEGTTADLVAYDLEGRSDRVLLEDSSGWESGTGTALPIGNRLAVTFFAEAFGSVQAIDLATDGRDEIVGVFDRNIAVGVGESEFGEDAAFALVEPRGNDLPWTLLSREFLDFAQVTATSLPMGDGGWDRVSSAQGREVIASDGVAIVANEFGFGWLRLEQTVPGIVVVADDLAIG